MSFGFWFWQFDRSGSTDRVMSLILKSVTSVVTTALGLFGKLIDLVQLTGLWSLIPSITSVVTTALGLFV